MIYFDDEENDELADGLASSILNESIDVIIRIITPKLFSNIIYIMEDFDRDLFDELMNVSSNEYISDCEHDTRIIDGHYTCILCGVVDINRIQFHESIQRSKSILFTTASPISEKK